MGRSEYQEILEEAEVLERCVVHRPRPLLIETTNPRAVPALLFPTSLVRFFLLDNERKVPSRAKK
jgi:hypothetical protein